MLEPRIIKCKFCGKEFVTHSTNGMYCSRQCRNAVNNTKKKVVKVANEYGTRYTPDRVNFNKNDLTKYKQRAKCSTEELGLISFLARSEHHETYGQYISHEQSQKSDADMRIRHEVWKLNQEKAKEKKADEPISEGGKAVFRWISSTKPKHST